MKSVAKLKAPLLAIVALSCVLLTDTCNAQSPAKVGAFVQTSGADASAAKAFEQGMQIAAGQKSPPRMSLQFLDANQGKTPEGAALKSFVETDRVPLLVYWSVDDISAVAPYLTQSRVIGLVSWEVTKKVSSLGNHIFGFGFSTEMSFAEFAKFAGNTLKSYRFGIISATAPRYDTQSKAFIEQSKSLGNTIVFDEKVDPGSTDFAAVIARAKKEKCDTIFATLPAPALVAFVKAARAAFFKGHVLVGDELYASDIALLGKDAEGIYMMHAWSDDAAFASLYAAKYGQTPDNVILGAAALGFDTVNCVQETGTPLGSSIIKSSLLSKSCEGLTGKTQFSGERIAQRKKRVVTVKDGKFSLAQ